MTDHRPPNPRCGGITINGSWPPPCCETHVLPWGHDRADHGILGDTVQPDPETTSPPLDQSASPTASPTASQTDKATRENECFPASPSPTGEALTPTASPTASPHTGKH